jgi:hypothetical protein
MLNAFAFSPDFMYDAEMHIVTLKQKMEVMKAVASKESVRLVHPFLNLSPEHIQISPLPSKDIIAEKVLQTRLTKIVICSALQI